MSDLDAIVERLQRELGPAAGPPAPLHGGQTNRNFRIAFSGRECVVRLPGRETSLLGISRDAERIANRAAATLGIAPAVLAAEPDCLVTEFVVGVTQSTDRVAADPEPFAHALRAFHDSGEMLPVSFWVPELLEAYAATAVERGGELPPAYGQVQAVAGRIARALPPVEPAPCHNDLLCGNLIRTAGGGVMLVDWEYAGMGPRMFDLGNLAVNNEFDAAAEERMLRAYFGEPPSDGRRAALRLMRIMSDAREGAWGVVQSVVSELDIDFNSYAQFHFSRLLEAAKDPSFEEWLDAATA